MINHREKLTYNWLYPDSALRTSPSLMPANRLIMGLKPCSHIYRHLAIWASLTSSPSSSSWTSKPVVDGRTENRDRTRVAPAPSMAVMLSCVAQQDLHGIAESFGVFAFLFIFFWCRETPCCELALDCGGICEYTGKVGAICVAHNCPLLTYFFWVYCPTLAVGCCVCVSLLKS